MPEDNTCIEEPKLEVLLFKLSRGLVRYFCKIFKK